MRYKLLCGDALSVLKRLPDQIVQCVITSPPYFGLRDYGAKDQIGLEDTPEKYVQRLVSVFREVRRVLKDDGTLWLNLGDSYVPSSLRDKGYKEKDLIGIPWSVAFALRGDGWYLRQDIIWHKPNPMPESVKNRCTKAHEYIFLLSKSDKYFYDNKKSAEPALFAGAVVKAYKSGKNVQKQKFRETATGKHDVVVGETRNRRSVWSVPPSPLKEAHFAVFPPELVRPCIQAGSPVNGIVMDPFNGSGTTGVVSMQEGCRYIGIDLNQEYIEMARNRIEKEISK